MKKTTAKAHEGRMISESESALDHLIREGARKMLQSALDYEVAEFIERMKSRRTEEGLREIVRNGPFPGTRHYQRGGSIARQTTESPRPKSRIPVHQSDSASVHAAGAQCGRAHPGVVFERHLHGRHYRGSRGPPGAASGGTFGDDHRSIEGGMGGRVRGLGGKRSLAAQSTTSTSWADGIYFNVRLEHDRRCILVLMGATRRGWEERAYRRWPTAIRGEQSNRGTKLLHGSARPAGLGSSRSWRSGRGVGVLGGSEEVFSEVHEQRCWVHKTARIS